jgi:general stress protein YciG
MRSIQRTDEETTLEGAGGKTRAPRGFAVMDIDLVRRLASRGGRAAHERGTAHEFTPEEARAAGRKGGLAQRQRRGAAK